MRTRSDFYSHQPLIVDFQKEHWNCACYVPMGGAKTVSTLTAFKDLQEEFGANKAIVFAPLRVARKVWSDEIEEWSHLQGLTTSKIVGTEKQRLKGLNTPADIHLINRENTVWLTEQFIQGKKQIREWEWDTVILDESQSYKSISSKRWKALRRIRRLFPRMIQLTGTPAPNGYEDLWAQIFLLDGGARLGKTMSEYHDRWFTEKFFADYSVWYLKPGAKEEIQNALKDIVLSIRLEDHFDLPEVPFNPVRVSLSPAALATYKKFARTSVAEFSGKTVSAASAGVLAGKLCQLANGCIYTGEHGEFAIFHDEKLKALVEVLEGCDGPVLIGYGYRSDASRIEKVLEEYCGREGKTWRRADSDADLQEFADKKIDYLLLHPASCGHGLNDMYKSGAANIVWVGLTHNLEHFQQLNARLTGGLRVLGRKVVVHAILADGTRDADTFAALTAKAATQSELARALVRPK